MQKDPRAHNTTAREFANQFACQLARKRLASFTDIERQCHNAGAHYDAALHAAVFPYLDRTCRVSWPEGNVTDAADGSDFSMKDTILILDYFTQARGTALTKDLITYKELRDGLNYFSVFHTRAIQPLIKYFGNDPQRMVAAAARMGGSPADFGDAAVLFHAFPNVPLIYIIWKGDTEFDPEGSILFNSTVSDYLTNDDIHSLCETIVWRLVRLDSTGGDNTG